MSLTHEFLIQLSPMTGQAFVGKMRLSLTWTPVRIWSDVVFQGTLDQRTLIEPERGALETTTANRLAKILSHHTETPENCWFLIWEGYNLTQQTKESASIVVPLARTMHVLGGPRGTDSETFSSETFPAPLWWIPNDQKSCVGNDIYSRSVFIGGTFAAIGDILSDPLLEAYLVSPRQPLDTED